MLTARRQFIADYTRIRHAEGRGSDASEYYRALPYADDAQWRIRARSYDYFVRNLLPKKACDILDAGAGNCWLSNRLALSRHRPVAVDIFSDSRDGLRAGRHYEMEFPRLEAEFDHLPVRGNAFDLIVFNASIHYSIDYERTLTEARRCLRPNGRVVILDSPVYARRAHGELMRAERHAAFERQYGTRSEAIPSIEYFDPGMLNDLARKLHLKWRIHRPWYGWGWHLRPWKARLQGKRPPSRFWILEASFDAP